MGKHTTLQDYAPKLVKEWHPTKNGTLTPDQVSFASHKKAWWLCEKGHEWQAFIYSRTCIDTGCPYCSGKYVIRGETDLATVNPSLAEQWHSTKNGDLTPEQVTPKSGKKVWWECDKGHEWQATVLSRALGGKCKICNKQSNIQARREAWVKKNGSLLQNNPGLAAQWHPTKNGSLSPDRCTGRSEQEVWWLCPTCGHEWKDTVDNRAKQSTCPRCRLISKGTLLDTHPELAAQWHPTKNGDLKPEQFTHGSTHKVWWLGECGHEWEALINNRSDGTGCPICYKNRGSTKQKTH